MDVGQVVEQLSPPCHPEAEEGPWGWQLAEEELPLLRGPSWVVDVLGLDASKGHLWKGAPWREPSCVQLLCCHCCCCCHWDADLLEALPAWLQR